MDSQVLMGLLGVVALALGPVIAVSLLVRANLIYEACVTFGRRIYLLPTPEPRVGPPLEKLAAELRRLRPEARAPRPDVPVASQQASLAAYDRALVAAGRALDVPTILAELPDGFDREVERRRLENALEHAGLAWQLRKD